MLTYNKAPKNKPMPSRSNGNSRSPFMKRNVEGSNLIKDNVKHLIITLKKLNILWDLHQTVNAQP